VPEARQRELAAWEQRLDVQRSAAWELELELKKLLLFCAAD
jgi:hypothetical protein